MPQSERVFPYAASHPPTVRYVTKHAIAQGRNTLDGDENEVVVHPILPTSAFVTTPIRTNQEDGSGLVDGGIPKLA